MADSILRIQVYRFCPRCGSDAFAIEHAHLTACPACGLKLYHNPCGAAGAILVDPSNRVLLVRRAHEPAKGKLAFPGGFVDDGESAEQALERELMEEVGLEVTRYSYVCSHPNTYHFGGVIYPTLDVFYSATVADFDEARALDEVDELVIRGIDELAVDDLAFDSTKAAWVAFLKTVRPQES
jgi:ADP-ribose pyrophosphatase YjhB (NUDIX family)